jgi:hypothetical protein
MNLSDVIPSLFNINEVEVQRQGDLAWFKALEKRWVITGPGRRLQRPQSAVGGATNNNSTPGLILLPFPFSFGTSGSSLGVLDIADQRVLWTHMRCCGCCC